MKRPQQLGNRLVLALSLVAPAAYAHKAKDADHTHCTLDGKGVAIEGKTDAERKTDCAKIKGAVWDETKASKIERQPPPAEKKPGD